MKTVSKRKVDSEGEVKPEFVKVYDDFRPTLKGFEPLFDAVLLRELQLPEEGFIVTPDAFAEACLYCEVVASGWMQDINIENILETGSTVRILKGIGTTIQFSDTEEGQRYFTVHAQDIIGKWSR
jgi:hypothetical protein